LDCPTRWAGQPDVVSDVRGGTLDGMIVNRMRRWVFVAG